MENKSIILSVKNTMTMILKYIYVEDLLDSGITHVMD